MTDQAKVLTKPHTSGDVIAGKYRLEALLGEGGMGAVWRARHLALDAPVAIKVLRAEGDRSALSGRLLLEARAAARLSHPAIVKVFDVGQTERGEPFIAMELLSGTSLGDLLHAEGCLPATSAVQMLLPIADALAVAHGKGLVHRDVKPDNIFVVNHEGAVQPKLVDFGIVKIGDEDRQLGLTQAGAVMGSPDYLSPEQAKGLPDIDQQSDVWAFCVVLFETIAGRVPFDAKNYNALLRQIVESRAPLLREVAPVDERLSAIVARGLEKERINRFRSMTELGQALAQWLLDQGVADDVCGTALESKWLRRGDRKGREAVDPWLPEPRSGVRMAFDVPTAAARPLSPADTAPRQRASFWLTALLVAGLLAGLSAFALSLGVPPTSERMNQARMPTPASVASALPSRAAAAAQPDAAAPSIAVDQLPLEQELAPAAASASAPRGQAVVSASGRRNARSPVRKALPKRGDLLSPY